MALIHRIQMIGNAASQLLNTLLGGWSDESVSSRSWRMSMRSRRWAAMRALIDWLFRPFGPGHCREAFNYERARLSRPPELRGPAGG